MQSNTNPSAFLMHTANSVIKMNFLFHLIQTKYIRKKKKASSYWKMGMPAPVQIKNSAEFWQ